MKRHATIGLALASTTLPFLASFAQDRPGATTVGQKPAFTFRGEGLDQAGVRSLADLVGKPVLVDFWGVKCPPCVGFAVPKGVEMQRQYGDDLQVVFVESQGHDLAAIERLAFESKWTGSNAVWTTERPFDVGLDGIPHFALLDVDGQIILQGYTSELHGKLEELVAEQVELVRKGPRGLAKELKGAWKLRAKGEFAKALEEARKADAAGAPDVAGFTRAVETAAETQLRRLEWWADNGRAHLAADAAPAFALRVAGMEGVGERAKALAERLAGDEAKAELEASKELARAEADLSEEGFESRNVLKKLEKLAAKHPGTKAAARASHLIALAGAPKGRG